MRPDGDVAQFKCAAFGVAPDLNDFTRLIGSAIDRGFAEARKILEGLGERRIA